MAKQYNNQFVLLTILIPDPYLGDWDSGNLSWDMGVCILISSPHASDALLDLRTCELGQSPDRNEGASF